MSLHSPEILSKMSLENSEGFSLNLSLQFFSRHSRASRTLSGFSNLVSAARRRSCLAPWISMSEEEVVVVEDRKIADFGGERLDRAREVV